MSLKLLSVVPNIITYNQDRHDTWIYSPEIPAPYSQSLRSLKQFFYEPNGDKLVLFAWFTEYNWPSWSFKRMDFDAATGVLVNEETAISLFWSHWTNKAQAGSYKKIYATGNAFTEVIEVNWETMEQAAGGFVTLNWAGAPVFTSAIVNREDSLIIGTWGQPISVYNFTTHALLGQIVCPCLVGDMTMEDRSKLWVVSENSGIVAKINYKDFRHELVSKLQVDYYADTVDTRITYDSLRKRIIICNYRADAVDGSCRVQLEFYDPRPISTLITSPVPLNALQVNNKVTFETNIIGDAGEPMSSISIEGELDNSTVGHLNNSQATTDNMGRALFRYACPATAGLNNLTVEATVEDIT